MILRFLIVSFSNWIGETRSLLLYQDSAEETLLTELGEEGDDVVRRGGEEEPGAR